MNDKSNLSAFGSNAQIVSPSEWTANRSEFVRRNLEDGQDFAISLRPNEKVPSDIDLDDFAAIAIRTCDERMFLETASFIRRNHGFSGAAFRFDA